MNSAPNNFTRWLALLAAVTLLLVALALPRGERLEPLQVAVGVWPGVETLILARERGMLPRNKVQLIDMPWPSAAMRAFGNGVVDAAVLSLDEVLRLQEPGREVKVMMVMDVSVGADKIIGGHGLTQLTDLRGKRVGVDVRSSSSVLMESALESVGMKSSEVELVPISPSEAESAMTENQVDAVVLAEPWATRVLRSNNKVLFDSRQLKLPIYRVLVASTNAFEKQHEELQLLVAAHFAVQKDFLLEQNPAAWAVLLRREGVELAEFQQALRLIKMFDQDDSLNLLMSGGELATQSALLEDFMHRAGLLEGPKLHSGILDERGTP